MNAKRMLALSGLLTLCVLTSGGIASARPVAKPAIGYAELTQLFLEWRTFEASGRRGGAPDYTPSAMARKASDLKRWQARLVAINPSGWPIAQQVDHKLVAAEMNALDFDLRVLRPWQRDPAYYVSLWTSQSDTPAHEGPIHHAPIELWTYSFPLSAAAEAKLIDELKTVPPLLEQARSNLTGNARDLWQAGIVSIEEQGAALGDLAKGEASQSPALRKAVAEASNATVRFIAWLKQQAPSKTGPSGIGKENYSWYLRNVQLSPLNWEDEVAILTRELGRSHATLRLEEHRNRSLPQLTGAVNTVDYERKATAAVRKFIKFLGDGEILTVRDYMQPALMARIGGYVPPDQQNFFQIAMHRAPMTLWTHFYHWFDLANMAADPNRSLIRRGPLLYNIWVSRSEGLATAFEEMMLHAGLFDDDRRAREIVWILQAQRAARGLASLYAHANLIDMTAARKMQVARTPNGWMSPTLPLLATEQQLYLRQPGYGTSYVTGKHQIEKLFAELAERQGSAFSVKGFFDSLNGYGMIPVSMIRLEMLGAGGEIKPIGTR